MTAPRWARHESAQAIAAADAIAATIAPERPHAFALLADERTTLAELRAAKDAFKTMRLVAESSATRRLAARLYAAAIAAALVRHGASISRQSNATLRRALTGLGDDSAIHDELRRLAVAALALLPTDA